MVMITQTSPLPDASVSERYSALIALFSQWSESGLPSDVKIPKSTSAARTWTCPEHGIPVGIGSKRDFSSNHPVYGKSVRALAKLVSGLQSAPVERPRTTETAKAKVRRLELLAQQYKARLEGVSTQFSEADEALTKALSNLAAETERNRSLQRKLDLLADENARLKRELASGGVGLRVVE
jgi:GAF domain-containing protein